MKLSVFTVCMPEYTPEEGVGKLREWGCDGVEWRVTTPPGPGAPVVNFWNGNRCTVDPATILAQAPALRRLCRRHKLAIPALATYAGHADLKTLGPVFEAAAVMGARGVRVGTAGYDGKTPYDRVLAGTLKGWRAVAKLARRHGVKALLEIHMGTIVPSASAARRLAGAFDPREVGVIHDAGNMVYEGFENWQMGMEILGPYLAHVHVKNGSWAIRAGDPDGNLRWRCDADSLRHGAVSWADVILALRRVGYDGWLSLEDFSAGATDEKLRDDVAYLRALLAAAGEKV